MRQILTMLFLFFFISGFSQTPSEKEIKTVAVNFYNYLTGQNVRDDNIKKQEKHVYKGVKTYVIVVFDNNDWVAISTDKNIDPVLAFSEENSYSDSINPNAKFWFELYDYYIYNAKQNKIYEEEDKNKDYPQLWKDLIANDLGKYMQKSLGNNIAPLITTKWGQSESNTGNDPYAYNYYALAGKDNSGNTCNQTHALAGCPAVAAGQILRYWEYPMCSVFNWGNMPNALDAGNVNYFQYRNEIANLLRNLADKMQEYMGNSHYYYGCNGSGTNSVEAILYPIKDNFYFNAAYIVIKNDYSLGDWEDLIYHELSFSRPVLYTGFSSVGGHAFVCDGYKYLSDDYFHFNFGWNGAHDGYYKITNPYGFTSYQKAIIHIIPNCETHLTIYQFYKDVPGFHSKFYHPEAGTIYSSPMPIVIANGDVVHYRAYDEIVLENFATEDGSEFTAEIVPCPMDCGIYTDYKQSSKSSDNLSDMELEE